MKPNIRYVLSFILALSCFSCITPRKGPQRSVNNAGMLKPFDALIVPGSPFVNGGWDTVMKARVLWSWIMYKNGYAKNIIFSGAAVYTPYKEALVMGMYAQQLGIPAANIFYDTLARHSTENIYYSYLLAKRLGFKTVALGTDPFQAFLLRGFTKKRFGTHIYHLPFVTDSLARYNHLNPAINAKMIREKNWQAIHETESFLTRFRGTLGRDIDWSKYKNGRLDPL